MKIRSDFVTNSSSTSFIITNKTKKTLDLEVFARENSHLVGQYLNEYSHVDDSDICRCRVEASAKLVGMKLKPGKNTCVFGDEDGTLVGRIYDYVLRYGGESDSFKWELDRYLR